MTPHVSEGRSGQRNVISVTHNRRPRREKTGAALIGPPTLGARADVQHGDNPLAVWLVRAVAPEDPPAPGVLFSAYESQTFSALLRYSFNGIWPRPGLAGHRGRAR